MLKIKRFLALALSTLMLMATLSGCASGDQILIFGTTGIDGEFNPIMSDNVYDSYVVSLVFDQLVVNDREGAWHGGIASYTRSDDNLTYTFTLKDGIKFSDGTAMTTEDVAFTYQTIAHPDYNGPRSYVVADFLGYDEYRAGETDTFAAIQIIDDKTISFTFKPGTASPANIECFQYGIMPKHYYDFTNFTDFLDLSSEPLGSGRFILDDYRHREFVKLSANRSYWDRDNRPKIRGILMSEIPQDSLIDAFNTGQVHIAQPSANLDNVAAYTAMEGVTPQIFLGNGYTYLCFNTLRPTLSDVRVRQALMHGVDRASFIEAEYGDLGSIGLAPISPASWAFPESGMNDYAFDIAKANQLMDEAGWVVGSDGIREKDGVRMELSWLVYTEVAWPGRLAEMAADTWRDIGVDLTIELMDFNTVIARAMDPEPGEKDFDIYTMGFSLAIDPDPTGALFDHDAFVAGGFNASGYYNARSQELITLGKQEFDQARRTEIYHEWAALMNYELPTVIVAYRNELWAVSDKVSGVDLGVYWNWTADVHNFTISN